MSFTVEQVDLLDANAEHVEYRRLFELTLLGQTFRLAESEYDVTAGGQVWQAGLRLIKASPIERGEAFQAVPAEYIVAALPINVTDDSLAAFERMSRAVMTDQDAWFGGTIHQFLQLLVQGQAVGSAISLHRGWIRDVVPVESAATAQFRVRAESIFARRNRTPLGEYTDRDQQRRSPGDRGCEFTPTFADKTVTGWPF